MLFAEKMQPSFTVLLQTAWRRKATMMTRTLKVFVMEHSGFTADLYCGYGDSHLGRRKSSRSIAAAEEEVNTMAKQSGKMCFAMQQNRWS